VTCPDCLHAEEHPNTVRMTNGCDGCAARAIACTTIFHDSIANSVKSPQYRMALAQFFPGREQQGQALIVGWFRRLQAQRQRSKVAA
jgi:hypothetical protein